jgi:simple sugar transport system permease protein
VSGIPVNLRRRQAILVEGMMAGLGGGYLVLGQVGSFEAGAVGGRGFIAIAAVIFGGWTLWGTIFGCLVFGMADAFRLAMPTLGYQANPQLLGSLPYLLTVVVMIVFARANRQPRALARPFVRGLT